MKEAGMKSRDRTKIGNYYIERNNIAGIQYA